VPVSPGGEALRPLHWYGGPAAGPPGENAPPQLSLFLPKLRRFREEAPEAYRRTRYFFSSQEWLSHRLGAEAVTALAGDAYGPYYWDRGGCDFFGIDAGKFPPFVKLGTPIGKVSSRALRRLGALAGGDLEGWLPPGTPIAAGGPDFIAALTGTGVLEPGRAADRAGTSEGVNLCIADPPPAGEAGGLRFLPGAAEGLWNAGSLVPSSGRIFEDYRSRSGRGDRDYGAILAEIAGVPLRAEAPFFFPGSPPDPSLEKKFGAAELGRGVIEALGFLSAAAMDRLEARGFALGELRLSGGQCKSRVWNRIKADITGRVLVGMEISDGELAGDAAAALSALGDYGSVGEAAGRMVRVKERYEPDPSRAAFYAERRARYEAALRRRAEEGGRG
jgi:xylulokinase